MHKSKVTTYECKVHYVFNGNDDYGSHASHLGELFLGILETVILRTHKTVAHQTDIPQFRN